MAKSLHDRHRPHREPRERRADYFRCPSDRLSLAPSRAHRDHSERPATAGLGGLYGHDQAAAGGRERLLLYDLLGNCRRRFNPLHVPLSRRVQAWRDPCRGDQAFVPRGRYRDDDDDDCLGGRLQLGVDFRHQGPPRFRSPRGDHLGHGTFV